MDFSVKQLVSMIESLGIGGEMMTHQVLSAGYTRNGRWSGTGVFGQQGMGVIR